MAYADSNSKFLRLVSVIDDTKTIIGEVLTNAGAFIVQSARTATGAGRAVVLQGVNANGTNTPGSDVQINVGAGTGTGGNGALRIEGTVVINYDEVSTPGALPALPLRGVIVIGAAGSYTPPTASNTLQGAIYEIYNLVAGNAVFTGLLGVTSVTLAQHDALRIYCLGDGVGWGILSTSGTVAP